MSQTAAENAADGNFGVEVHEWHVINILSDPKTALNMMIQRTATKRLWLIKTHWSLVSKVAVKVSEAKNLLYYNFEIDRSRGKEVSTFRTKLIKKELKRRKVLGVWGL